VSVEEEGREKPEEEEGVAMGPEDARS